MPLQCNKERKLDPGQVEINVMRTQLLTAISSCGARDVKSKSQSEK